MMVERLKNWVFPKSQSMVGIDIGTNSLKLVELAWKRKVPFFRNYSITPIPSSVISDMGIEDSEAFAEILSKALTTSGIQAREAILAVGGRNIFVREVPFPPMTEKELKEAIKWDMEKYVPYEADSYYYDYSIIPGEPSEKELKILLAAVPRHILDPLLEAIKNAGLIPRVVDLESLALYRTFSQFPNSMVLDIGGAFSQFFLFQQGVPVVNRTIPLGSERFIQALKTMKYQDGEQTSYSKQELYTLLNALSEEDLENYDHWKLLLSEFVREVRRTIEYYQIQTNQAIIDKIIMVGGGARLQHLHSALAKRLESPIILHNPLETMDISPSLNRYHIEEIAPQLSMAIGLALRGGEPL